METAAIWLRWTRAGTVATVATLLAVAAHLHADGDTPSLPATFLLISFLTAVSATFLARPASTLRVVLLTVGGQLVAHSVLTATSVHPARASVAPTMSAGMPGMTGHPAGHMVEHGVTGGHPR